jgi:hypothetical protein
MVIRQGVVVRQLPIYQLSFGHIQDSGLTALLTVVRKVSWLSTVEAVPLEGAALLLRLGLFLGLYDLVIGFWGWISSVSSRCPSSAQIHGYRHVVKVSRGIGRVVALELVLRGSRLVLLLVEPPPIGDSSPSFLEYLLYGFL